MPNCQKPPPDHQLATSDAAECSDPTLRNLEVTYRDIETLKPYPRNTRTHSRKQIRQIAESIRAFGFTNPILIGEDGEIIAGHGRLQAAGEVGIKRVPTISLKDMTAAQKRAYAIADNRLAEVAGWDRDLLAVELQYINELEIDFDLTITGFETVEIDMMFESLGSEDADSAADQLPEVDSKAPAVSRAGDLWCLDEHRLLCDDARGPTAFSRLMGGTKAQMVFTDPPYNVRIDGHVCGSGAIRHDEFMMASGEMSEAEYTEFLTTIFRNLVASSIDGSIHYHCMDWRHMYELLTAAREVYTELKNLCVWNKDNAGMGTFYRSKHELVFVWKSGTAPHINNFELGQNGRYRANVWNHPGVNTFRAGRLEDLRMHPTVKPVALVADAIKDCSKRRAIVLDCFAGSGTTVIAAEQTGRRAYAMELDPRYVDTAIRRWQDYTGGAAIHLGTGSNFAELQATRNPATPDAAAEKVGKPTARETTDAG
jgi:DNA modification methylase